jgi:hypothetical protein
MTVGLAAEIVAPRSAGRARSTLRATLRVAPAAPSSRSACSGLYLLVPRPVRQLSVEASRAGSSRPDQDPSALRALRCGSSLGPVVPRRRSRPLSGALCRTGRGNGWQGTERISVTTRARDGAFCPYRCPLRWSPEERCPCEKRRSADPLRESGTGVFIKRGTERAFPRRTMNGKTGQRANTAATAATS